MVTKALTVSATDVSTQLAVNIFSKLKKGKRVTMKVVDRLRENEAAIWRNIAKAPRALVGLKKIFRSTEKKSKINDLKQRTGNRKTKRYYRL